MAKSASSSKRWRPTLSELASDSLPQKIHQLAQETGDYDNSCPSTIIPSYVLPALTNIVASYLEVAYLLLTQHLCTQEMLPSWRGSCYTNACCHVEITALGGFLLPEVGIVTRCML